MVPTAYGISTVNMANALLNTIVGIPTWVQLHTGDPGAAQTAHLSLVTTRQQAFFNLAVNGAIALASYPSPWLMTGTETLAAISVWSAPTSGLPYWTAPLAATQTVSAGDTYTLQTCGLSIGPFSV